jgi:integrase/recombinase XerD
MSDIDLYDQRGKKKFLTQEERQLFQVAARNAEREVRTFCLMLLYSGCRISEALELSIRNIDFTAKGVVFRTLKKRGDKKIYRPVPLPDHFLDELNLVHNLKSSKKPNERIWSWSRATASRKVQEVMRQANLTGVQACPKGLRHGFVIHCIQEQIPLNMAIYANAQGAEERSLAERLW